MKLITWTGLVLTLFCALVSKGLKAQQPDSLLPKTRVEEMRGRVSPVMEIEVLDPNSDARGNPAVTLTTDGSGNLQVDIPPSVIVHRYYYTGDRSFRGPDLPGGPSIVVAQNPRDGRQVYLPVQMFPGSPVVHYSPRSIEYDFGNRAVIVTFPKVGDPVVSYRNGRPLGERTAKLVGFDKLKGVWASTKETAASVKQKATTAAQATRLAAGSIARPITLPAQNLTRFLPGAAALSDSGLEARVAEEFALRQQQLEIEQARREAQLNDASLPRPN